MKRLSPLALALLVACSSAASGTGAEASFTGDPYTSATSDTGALRVAVRTSPEPPPRGTCAVEMTFTRASGEIVDDLVLDVVPWMTAHGHGTSVKPHVTPKGQGKYVITDVNLFMPGTWELRTSLSGAVTDHVAPQLAVP